MVAAALADQPVVAAATIEPVGTSPTDQHVISASALQPLAPGLAVDHVVVATALSRVVVSGFEIGRVDRH